MKDIILLDLFSGIGGFSKGIQEAGFNIKKHYFSEIDKHAIAVYKYNFKNSIYAGPVKFIQSGAIERPDIITFGSPCQDFSLAGKRRGMEGESSSLILHAIRLITELRPSVFIWENVKGAFSSNNSEDFWAIIQAFTNIGGYRLEWQLLNTVWFLPQNRERIYLVGHLDGRSEPRVFPIGENDYRINERSIKTRSVRTLTAGGHSGGLHSSMTLVKTLQGDDTLNTIRSGGRGSLTSKHSWDIVQIGAMRGRNPENPTSRKSGLATERHLEINKNNTANTITSVQKDNVVISSFTRDNKGKVANRNDRDICNTITSATGLGGSTDVFVNNIRRLTEIECERLQGFPDNWTEFGIYEKEVRLNKKERTLKIVEGVQKVPKTQRYKMLGNAVTVNVVKAVTQRLKLLP